MKKEFHQILREKMQENDKKDSYSFHSLSQNNDPLHLAFLIGNIDKTKVSSQSMSQNYVRQSCNQTNRELSSATLPTPPPPPLHLNQTQKEAWLWFWKRGSPLSESFTQKELMKQFRKLALLLHPDKNHHPKANESFIQLREYYKVLSF